MLIKEMGRDASVLLLQHTRFGRIACVHDRQPYITPFFFAYHGDYLYSFATVGQKIDWMRANPLVCVEVEAVVSPEDWRTIVILGHYEELPETLELADTRSLAHELLATAPDWWIPGFANTMRDGAERVMEPVYFRIAIDKISGHEGTSGAPKQA